MKKFHRSAAFFVVLALVALLVASMLLDRSPSARKLSLDSYEQLAAEGQVRDAKLIDGEGKAEGRLAHGSRYVARCPDEYADELTTKLLNAGVRVEPDRESQSLWLSLL